MISICMATYNGEKYINDQLVSILKQTREPDEVIICDDCSTDNTSNIINNFIIKNDLIGKWKLIINNKNLGYPLNFYNTIENCNGDIIFFSDQDDIWEVDKIQKMELALEENSNILLLSCKHGIMDEQGRRISSYLAPSLGESDKIHQVYVNDILKKYQWPGMTMAIRKFFFNEISNIIKFNDIPHDFILAILASNINGFYFYDYIGVYHRRHENNLAREEHRVSELLKFDRKVREISEYNKMLNKIVELNYALKESNSLAIKKRLELSNARLYILRRKELKKLFLLYFNNRGTLRINSFISDLWLLTFGR